MLKPTILVVDDELSIRESLSLILEDDFKVLTAASGEGAVKKVADEKVDLVLLDIRMPGMDGIETLRHLKKIDKDLTVVMVTAVNDVEKASQATRYGSYEYMVKPFDVKDLLETTKKLAQKRYLVSETRAVRTEASHYLAPSLIGDSTAITALKATVKNLKDELLMISGPAGTEKELAASVVHNHSGRTTQPFLIFNCAGMSSPYDIRTALFGRESGTSTQTIAKHIGILAKAQGGSIFFANIELLPTPIQEELFMAIRNREFTLLGSTSPIAADFRFMAGTNADLKLLAEKREFSKNLLSLICSTEINLPPIAEREEDVPLWLDFFLTRALQRANKAIKGFNHEAGEILATYRWPGNVAEIEKVVELAVLGAAGDEITPLDLPLNILIGETVLPNRKSLAKLPLGELTTIYEKAYINAVLENAGNDTIRAAQLLKVSPFILDSKL